MSKLSELEQKQLKQLGSVLIKKLTKDELRTLSLALLDTIMDREINPLVGK